MMRKDDTGSAESDEVEPEIASSGAPVADSAETPVGMVSDALVELIDIAPTLLELADLPIPQGMQGRSLSADPARGDPVAAAPRLCPL